MAIQSSGERQGKVQLLKKIRKVEMENKDWVIFFRFFSFIVVMALVMYISAVYIQQNGIRQPFLAGVIAGTVVSVFVTLTIFGRRWILRVPKE